jgi:hypothetical protein
MLDTLQNEVMFNTEKCQQMNLNVQCLEDFKKPYR